jgi:hypothetical protein
MREHDAIDCVNCRAVAASAPAHGQLCEFAGAFRMRCAKRHARAIAL